jgi:hypothetical protein
MCLGWVGLGSEHSKFLWACALGPELGSERALGFLCRHFRAASVVGARQPSSPGAAKAASTLRLSDQADPAGIASVLAGGSLDLAQLHGARQAGMGFWQTGRCGGSKGRTRRLRSLHSFVA